MVIINTWLGLKEIWFLTSFKLSTKSSIITVLIVNKRVYFYTENDQLDYRSKWRQSRKGAVTLFSYSVKQSKKEIVTLILLI